MVAVNEAGLPPWKKRRGGVEDRRLGSKADPESSFVRG